MAASFDATYGALFIGVVVSTILFGIMVLQVYIYYQNYPEDPWYHKLSVAWLCSLDALHLILITQGTYHHLITNFGNQKALARFGLSFRLQIVINVLIVATLQILYSYRVWHLNSFNKKAVLPWIVSFMVIVTLVETIVLSINVMDNDLTAQVGKFSIKFGTYFTLGWACVYDFLVAGILCYHLSKARTGFKGSDSVVSTLMAYTINTGLLTGIIYISAIICYATMHHNLIFFVIEWFLARLYVNSYMAMFNNRNKLRVRMQAAVTADQSFVQTAPIGVYTDPAPIRFSTTPNPQFLHVPSPPARSLSFRSVSTSPTASDFDPKRKDSSGQVESKWFGRAV